MATSGVYTWTVTRDDIIRLGMIFIGKLGENETPTASEVVDCSTILTAMVKQWMGRQDFAPGLKMWLRTRGNLFLSLSTGVYDLGPSGDNWTADGFVRTTLSANSPTSDTTLTVASIAGIASADYCGVQLDSGDIFWTTVSGAPSGSTVTIASGLSSAAASGNYVWTYTSKQVRPLLIETAVLRDENNVDVPLRMMTLQDYERLPTKAASDYVSDPSAIYYEPQLTDGRIYTDVGGCADVTKQIHMVFLREVQDFVNPTDNPDYSKEWYLPLAWGLAKQIAPVFNAPWTEDMQDNFASALAMAREANSENTTLHFQPGTE